MKSHKCGHIRPAKLKSSVDQIRLTLTSRMNIRYEATLANGCNPQDL